VLLAHWNHQSRSPVFLKVREDLLVFWMVRFSIWLEGRIQRKVVVSTREVFWEKPQKGERYDRITVPQRD
jgi:hypothetical protein